MKQKIIEVELFTWQKTRAPHILTSGELGPCIAIAIYNPQSKSGYIVHDPSPGSTDCTSGFFKKVEEENRDLSILVAFAAGAGVRSDVDQDYVPDILRTRRLVEQELYQRFRRGYVTIQWSQPYQTAILSLDTQRGKFDLNLIDAEEI